MKTMKNFLLLLAAVFSFASCEKDEDKIYLSSIESGELVATESTVVLSQENSNDIVLSLAWTKDALQISDPALSAIDVTIQTLQISTTQDFSGVVSENVGTSLSKAYTGAALNTLAKNLGANTDVANNVYFRLAAQTGKNMTPVYSNVVTISVTPYTIDMSLGYILNADKAETGVTLYSAASDGQYLGFMGATSWYNFFMKEGDGTVWGNDGVTGTAFLMSSDEDDKKRWNFWFPGQNGCYYVDVNTGQKLWSALYIPTLSVNGDVQGEMTFDRSNVKWTLAFNAAQAGSITLQVSGTGYLYDSSTGTDDSTVKSMSVAFAQSGESLTFGGQVGNITVDVPVVGECMLVIDLSNPKQWTVEVNAGSGEEPTETSPYVYLPGINDGEAGWTFGNYLRLYDEDNLGYAGCADVNAPWGYQIAIEPDNWGDVYTLAEGDTSAGMLIYQAEVKTNLPAPDGGLCFFDVSLKNLTYTLTAVEDVIYYSGFNDNWDLHPMVATEMPGVFTANITVDTETSNGFQIVLDMGWKVSFGGSNNLLFYRKDDNAANVEFDSTIRGTFSLMVDVIKGTYILE